MTPTDAQVIERLARFCGWLEVVWSQYYKIMLGRAKPFHSVHTACPNFLESSDALRPVLDKLTLSQRNKLLDIICDQVADCVHDPDLWELLTLPPRTLAIALYDVIGETKV